MAHRTFLTERQRSALFDLPTDRTVMLRHYTLADDLAGYASREETRHEHMAALRDIYDYKMFTGRGSRDLKVWLENEAETARSNEDLARRFIEQCRATYRCANC